MAVSFDVYNVVYFGGYIMPIDRGRRNRQSRGQPLADSSDDPQLDDTVEPKKSSSPEPSGLAAKDAERG